MVSNMLDSGVGATYFAELITALIVELIYSFIYNIILLKRSSILALMAVLSELNLVCNAVFCLGLNSRIIIAECSY